MAYIIEEPMIIKNYRILAHKIFRFSGIFKSPARTHRREFGKDLSPDSVIKKSWHLLQ